MAVVYDGLGRYAEAEPLLKRALAIRDATNILNELANLYSHQDRYAEAERLFRRTFGPAGEGARARASGRGRRPRQSRPRSPASRAAMPRPSRCCGARLPSARRRSGRTMGSTAAPW
ncbi:MAG: tetratricopeptide repeat protein [Hyphomicrobiaceae bacterium]|nr:tetratricopeptide repeat protein [Hyphomicrobiaceae bacterium]